MPEADWKDAVKSAQELANSGKASRKRKAEDTVLTASEAGDQKEA